MGKKLRDEDLVLNIIINGDQGKKEMGELERAIKDTSAEVRSLEREQKKLAEQNKKDTKEYKAVTAAIKQKNEAIMLAEVRLKQLRSTMDVSAMSTRDLRREMTRLKMLKDVATPNSEAWIQHDRRLQQVTTRYNELNGRAQATGIGLQNLAGKFNHYIGVITAGLATFFTVITGARTAINEFAKFDDRVADVMKTTGLLKSEVLSMNESLKSFDTRTAQDELLGLGRVAGKLGITGREDVEGFIRSADKISVALKEDLGGDVEEAVNSVGKLIDIFKIKDIPLEEALLKVGSTINELGAASTANEGFLVDFAKRTAGLAPSAKISITEILGLAATLDQLGQTSEVSSTTFNNLIPKMFTNTKAFADLAKMSVEDFTELLNRDANSALIKFLEGVRGNTTGLSEMINNMGDLEIDGSRATSVIAVLANNTEILKEQQILANAAYEEGTSLTEEFNIKNETAAAQLEKARKGLQNIVVELGEKLMPVMTVSTSGFSYMIRLLTILIDFFFKYRTIIVSVTAAVLAYNAAVFIQNRLTTAGIALAKLKVFWDNTMLISTQLLAAAQMLLTGNLKGAAQAMRIVNSVVMANPYAAVAALVIALGVAVYNWTKDLTSAEKAQARLNDIVAEAEKSIVSERLELEKLVDIARDKSRSDEDRRKAMLAINRISPEFLGNLTLEKIGTEEATKAIDAYIEAMIKKAAVQAAEEELVEIQKKRIDAQRSLGEEELTTWQKTKLWTMRVVGFMHEQENEMIEGYRAENRENLKSDLDAQENLLKNFIKENQRGVTTVGGVDFEDPSKGGADVQNQIETMAKLEEQLKKLREVRENIDLKDTAALKENELQQIEIQNRLNKLQVQTTAQRDSESKKRQKIIDKEEKEEEKLLKKQQEFRDKYTVDQMDALAKEEAEYNERLKEAGLFNVEIQKLSYEQLAVREQMEKDHLKRVNAILQENVEKRLGIHAGEYDRQLMALRASHNDQYKEIQSLEQARAFLRGKVSEDAIRGIKNMRQAQQAIDKVFIQEEEQLAEQYLTGLLDNLKQLQETGEFDGINLATRLLSEEDKAELQRRIDEVKLKLSELGLASSTAVEDDRGAREQNVDVLGMSSEDWEIFFENLKNGELRFQDLMQVAQSMIGIYAQYAAFVNAGEQRELAEYERAQERKKEALKARLDQGFISQSQYTKQVEQLDADLEKKKAVHDRNAAKRERNIALMSAIVNTAAAIAAALPNIALSIIVGAMGALQIGTIMRTPLPEIPGAESGGFVNVVRSQDGKRFRAKNRRNQRGYIDDTSVIIAEDGGEFVASADAVRNPTVAPVLDAIDTAQRQGRISSLNLLNVLDENRELRSRIVPGRQKGGRVRPDQGLSGGTSSSYGVAMNGELIAVLKANTKVMAQVSEQLKRPLQADVNLTGRKGLEEKQKELDSIRNSASL